MTNIIDKIGLQIYNFNFWRMYARPIRKSMRKVDKYMDEAIGTLEQAMVQCADEDVEVKICTTMEQFLQCVARSQETIIMEGDLYKLWRRYMRAATKRKTSQTVNVSGEWNVTFGYGDDMVIFSTPRRGRNTIGVYRTGINTSAKNIIFTRVE